MKLTKISFAKLQNILRELGFVDSREKKGWRFSHAPSGTEFYFRPYLLTDRVQMADLMTVRSHLDWRGLLNPDAFESRLNKGPA